MQRAGGRGQYIDSVDVAAAALRDGELVAFPTETVYGLGAHAFDADAVARIFEVKGRPRTDPLIVHVPTAEAAEALVRLDAEALALMRRLAARFWPGPLTLVAPACADLPSAVTANSGFVGVRCPAHSRAMELLRTAAVPVAAPSANRFGHVSPTKAEHVMDDLGAHAIFVLRPQPDATTAEGASAADAAGGGGGTATNAAVACCDVGIESTVAKIDASARELCILRRGGVPETVLARWMAEDASGFQLRVRGPTQPPAATATSAPTAPTAPTVAAPTSTPAAAAAKADADADADAADAAAAAAATTAASGASSVGDDATPDGTVPMVSPGMLLTHYSPDLPSYLLAPSSAAAPPSATAPLPSAAAPSPPPPDAYALASVVVLDFGGRLAHLRSAALAYRDLSPGANACEGAVAVFDALRWAEAEAANGARCVLLPDLLAPTGGASDGPGDDDASPTPRAAAPLLDEHAPALGDRLFRAASGKTAHLVGAEMFVAPVAPN